MSNLYWLTDEQVTRLTTDARLSSSQPSASQRCCLCPLKRAFFIVRLQ